MYPLLEWYPTHSKEIVHLPDRLAHYQIVVNCTRLWRTRMRKYLLMRKPWPGYKPTTFPSEESDTLSI
jgi:hypothetical protein